MPIIKETPLYSIVDTAFETPIYASDEKIEPETIKEEFPHTVDRDASLGAASFRKENLMVNVYNNMMKKHYAPEDGFNPHDMDDSDFDTKRRHLLQGSSSRAEYSQWLHQFEQENLDNGVIEESGIVGTMAQIGAGVVSAETFLPILGWSSKASLGKNIAVSGANALAVEGGRSAFLYSTQSNKSVDEAITEAAFATVFAGGLAAAAHGFSKVADDAVERSVQFNRDKHDSAFGYEDTLLEEQVAPHSVGSISRQMATNEGVTPFNYGAVEARVEAALAGNGDVDALKKALVAEGYDPKDIDELARLDLSDIEGHVGFPAGEAGDGGAAVATYRADQEATKLVNNRLVKALGMGPSMRLATSTNHAIREFAYKLYDDGLLRIGDKNGWLVKDDASSAIKGWGQDIGDIIDSEVNQYAKYKTRMVGINEPVISVDDFRVRVGQAMRRADVDEINEVAAVAKQIRKYFNKVSTKGKEVGLFTEDLDVKFAVSYFPRAYDLEKLSTFEGERLFKDKVSQGIQRKFAEMDEDIAEFKAEQILKNIMGDSATVFEGVVEGVKGSSLKARVLDFDDDFLEEFLKSDYREILMNYHRGIVPSIEVNKRFGTTDMHKMMEDAGIDRDEQLIAAGTDNKARKAIYKEYKQNEEDVELVLRRMGIKKKAQSIVKWAQPVSKTIKTFNNVTSLGGVVISSMPDVARVTLYNGFRPLAKTLASITANPSMYKMAVKEKKQFVAALEMVNNQRLAGIAGGDDYGMVPSSTKFMKGVDWANNKFFDLTLMRHWNSNLKAFNAQIQTDKVYDLYKQVNSSSKLKPKDITRLNELGIDTDTLVRIGKKIDEFGEVRNDLTIINMGSWNDDELATVFKNALIRDSDQKIITINEADLYSAFDDPVLSLFLQYKSFAMAAWNRVFVSGLQRGDMDTFMQFVYLLGMGAITTHAKRALNGDDSEMSADKLFLESSDNSGLATALMELSRTMELFSGNEHGLYSWTGNGKQTRNYNLNTGNAFGPSIGKYTAASQVITNTAQGNSSKYNQYKTLIPLNNHFISKITTQVFDLDK